MKNLKRYLQWIPFAISLGALVIYIVYTIQIKMNPAIIITDKLISTLKAYLIIALVSLFIGLLIILIKKIYRLMKTDTYQKTTTTTIYEAKPTKTVETTTYKVEENITEEPTLVKETITEVKTEPKVEEKIIIKETYHNSNEVLCPDCGNAISKNAAICPHCGILFDDEIIKVIKKYENGNYKPKRNFGVRIANIFITILFIILILLICNMLYNKYNENIKNINYIIKRN